MTILRPELYRSRNLDNWLQDFLRDDAFAGLWSDAPRPGFQSSRLTGLAADFYEDDNAFHAVLELPGVNKKDVTLALENSVLRISGNYTEKHGEEDPKSFEFSRSLALPEGVAASKVSAEMKDGLLTVTMPKQEETKPRTIEVQ